MATRAVVEHEIEMLDRIIFASEDWAKSYGKNPKAHAKLIKQQASLGRKLRSYFGALARERLDKYVNWSLYTSKLTAYKFNVVVDVEEIDSEEGDELLSVVHDPLQTSMALGALTAEDQYNIDLGLNEYNAAIMKANTSYVGELVKGITNTTKERIQQSIAQSINLRESRDQARERMMNVIDDERRAEMITRTETVRAYNKGISVFAEQSGATQKTWEISSDPCEICQDNDGATVDISDSFPSGDDEPPAHPNCRCGMSLTHSYNDGTSDTEETDDGE